jgi:hypothetical protein
VPALQYWKKNINQKAAANLSETRYNLVARIAALFAQKLAGGML